MIDTAKPIHTGHFTVSEGRTVIGELSLKGPDTNLYLHEKEWFNAFDVDESYLLGTLLKGKRVSLHQCLCAGTGSAGSVRAEENYYFANAFPHFVFVGSHHLLPDQAQVAEVTVSIDNAFELFHDYDSFGTSIGPADDLVREIIRRRNEWIGSTHTVEVFPEAEVAYWTGRSLIAEARTPFGALLARNAMQFTMPGKDGVKLDREVMISLRFDTPLIFDECWTLVVQLFNFLALVTGRHQTMKSMTVRLSDIEEDDQPTLQAFCSYGPSNEDKSDRYLWTGDCLLWPLEKPGEFSTVVSNWFTSNEEYWRPRASIIDGLATNRHGPDRIVRAANMFDHLKTPTDVEKPDISDELSTVLLKARELFSTLPNNDEKSRAMNALSGLQQPRAKHRIAARARKVMERTGGRYPKLDFVTDHGVLCRNYYVHGSKGAFDYDAHPNETFFLTQSLEFVFVASELIDCGWDIERWASSSTTQSHPLGAYKISYRYQLERLEMLVGRQEEEHG